jgi:hypothetical protein
MSTKKKKAPASAKNKRKDWQSSLPPESCRILIKDAVRVAGNRLKLAEMLGITRSAVYQWEPPYRHDPYMPVVSAIRFLDIEGNAEALQKMRRPRRKSSAGLATTV